MTRLLLNTLIALLRTLLSTLIRGKEPSLHEAAGVFAGCAAYCQAIYF